MRGKIFLTSYSELHTGSSFETQDFGSRGLLEHGSVFNIRQRRSVVVYNIKVKNNQVELMLSRGFSCPCRNSGVIRVVVVFPGARICV